MLDVPALLQKAFPKKKAHAASERLFKTAVGESTRSYLSLQDPIVSAGT